VLGIEAPPPPPDARADADAVIDAPAPCLRWQPQGFDACLTPRQAETLPPLAAGARYVYDTSMAGGTLYDPAGKILLQSATAIELDGATTAVLSLGTFDLPGAGTTLAVVGLKPLLVVSWSTITIGAGAKIDAGSHLGAIAGDTRAPSVLGAGADQMCASGAGHDGAGASDVATGGGSGGGGGGSFQDTGGPGGQGASHNGTAGGAGGSALAAPRFRGGCPGGTSGTAGVFATLPSSSATRAPGGSGGGAIRFVARDGIDIVGAISASGAGGGGGPLRSSCGGGGGGSGGYIGFEGPRVTIRGAVTSNGGAGGSGGVGGDTGNDGSDGGVDGQPAVGGRAILRVCEAGGPEIAAGGAGGAGGAAASAAQRRGGTGGDTGGCFNGVGGGGGGGGGGVGYIVATTPSLVIATSATVSPAAITP